MATELASATRGIPGEVVEYLHRHHVITLSTSSFTGMPHADTVVYMNDAHSIFFFAGEGTQMLRNIRAPPGILHTIVPGELLFADYDYALVAGQASQIRSRSILLAVDRTSPRDLLEAGPA